MLPYRWNAHFIGYPSTYKSSHLVSQIRQVETQTTRCYKCQKCIETEILPKSV